MTNAFISQHEFVGHAGESAAQLRLMEKSVEKDHSELRKLGSMVKWLEAEVAKAKGEKAKAATASDDDCAATASDDDCAADESTETSSSGNPNPFSQMSIGPAALAAPLIYKMMAMYNEVIQLDQEQQVNMLVAQKTEAQEQAKATKASGEKYGRALIIGAAIAFTMAIAGIGITMALNGTGAGKEANNKMKELNEANAPMARLEKEMSVEPERKPDGTLNGFDDMTKARVAELKAETYETKLKDGNGVELTETKKAELDRQAIAAMKGEDEFDFDNWKDTLQNRLQRNAQERNTIGQSIAQLSNMSQIANSVTNSAGQAGSGIASGKGSAAKGKYDAIATLEGVSSQMAGSGQQQFAKGMGDAYQASVQAEQALQATHRANSVQ